MARELISISVGQAGIQYGDTLWRQYSAEHSIDENGIVTKQCTNNDFTCFYEETKAGNAIYQDEFLLSDKQDAANNFVTGFTIIGQQMLESIDDSIRKLAEACDTPQGILIHHAMAGGTGSGVTAKILEHCVNNYGSRCKLGFEIFPFNDDRSGCPYEEYNTLLSLHSLMNYNVQMNFIFDNRQVYHLCQHYLGLHPPSFNDINLLMAKIESSLTCSLRFENVSNVHITSLHSRFLHRLHFMFSSMAPIVTGKDVQKVYCPSQILVDGFVRTHYPYYSTNDPYVSLLQYEPPLYDELMQLIYARYHESCNVSKQSFYDLNYTNDLMGMCCHSDNFTIECDNYNVEQDKTLAMTVLFRGKFTETDVCVARHFVKED
eukprot:237488_1